jgi:RNA polymerase sigma-70 factor (ECF subfamily)
MDDLPQNSWLTEDIYNWARAGAQSVLMGRPDVVEDVVQQLCVKLLEKRAQLKDISMNAFQAYVRTAARRLALNFLRNEETQRRIRKQEEAMKSEAIQGVKTRLDGFSANSQLERALSELGEEERKILQMKIVEGMNASEIAERVGSTEGAIRTRWFRIIRKLRDFYKIDL